MTFQVTRKKLRKMRKNGTNSSPGKLCFIYFVATPDTCCADLIQKYGRNVGGQTVQKPAVAPAKHLARERSLLKTFIYIFYEMKYI